MARKKKWKYLEEESANLESMTRNNLFQFAKNNGLIITDRRVKTAVIRMALIDYMKNQNDIDEEVEQIVTQTKTFEEIEKPIATKTPIEKLPRKLDI